MYLKFAILLSLVFSCAAFAEGASNDPGSIFHHQATANNWEVLGQLEYVDKNIKLNDNFPTIAGRKYTKGDSSGLAEIVKAQYGINSMLAVSLTLGAGKLTIKPTPGGDNAAGGHTYVFGSWSQNGMLDPQIALDGRIDNAFAGGTFRFGLPISIAFGKHKTDANWDSNLTSGATAIMPYIAYEHLIGRAGRLGVSLQESVDITDMRGDNSTYLFSLQHPGVTSYTRTGGEKTQLDVYYEQWFSTAFNLAVDLNYATQASTTTKVSSVETNDDNGISGLGGGLYATIFASSHCFIVPVIGMYGTANVSDQPNVKSASEGLYEVYVDYMF